MKLKKNITIIATLMVVAMSLCACGEGGTDNRTKGTKGVSDVLEEGVSKEEGTEKTTASTEEISEDKTTAEVTETATEETTEETTAEDTTEAEPKEATVVPPEIDVDLTKLSSTMVYSEVYNMMVEPDGYQGKMIKMNGPFAVYKDDATGKLYFACIIQDATACCSQGIEFQLAGDYSYPEDYPAEGDIITVTGKFSTYMEDGYMYVSLLDAKFE